KKIKQLIKKMGLKKYVILKGYVPHHQIVDLLHHAHIFLLASQSRYHGISEGIPNAIMEAFATGLPIISTNHGGIPEIVQDGVSGFLVPEKAAQAMADKLAYLIEHPEVCKSMGKIGCKHVKRYHNMKIQN